jgi:hypothetical protein
MNITDASERLIFLAEKAKAAGVVPAHQISSATGGVTAGLRKRMQQIMELVLSGDETDQALIRRYTVIDPGDRTYATPGNDYNVALSLPVASDIWYLAIGDSVLPFKGDNYQENSAKILGFLSKYLVRLDNIKPLKSLQSYKDLDSSYVWQLGRQVWNESFAPFVIRETRFETWMLNRNTEFPSEGSKASIEKGVTSKPETSEGQLYCGMLSFPVGPLGVMEVLSIFSESMDDMLTNGIPFTPDKTVNIENPYDFRCVTDQSLDGLMSPMTDMTGICPGVHLVEKGYLTVSRDAEYPAKGFTGYDKIVPFESLRYYLRRDAKWPLPGEFIGLLAKPWPTHVWWFQMTSPLLYSGNWFETNYYTSGVITEVLQPLEGSVGLAYKCVVRGVEVCIASSDFCNYLVGDRVAILRVKDLGRFLDKTSGNFKWKEMDNLIAREKLEKETPSNLAYRVNTNMMILPVTFYQP